MCREYSYSACILISTLSLLSLARPLIIDSDEEKQDLFEAYTSSHGHLPTILDFIPHSISSIDESRFISLLNTAISSGDLPLEKKWKKSSTDEKARKGRERKEKKEASEAEEAARELGVWEDFYGNGKGKREGASSASTSALVASKNDKHKRKDDGEERGATKKHKSSKGDPEEEDHGDLSALAAIIAKRQATHKERFDTLLDKYSGESSSSNGKGKGKGKSKKEEMVEPVSFGGDGRTDSPLGP